MASLSALSAGSMQVLRTRLEAIEGVERVLVDEDAAGLLLVLSGDASRAAVLAGTHGALEEQGVTPETVPVELTARVLGNDRHRVKFLGVERTMLPDARVRVQVSLQWDRRVRVGEEEGEASVPLEMRTAAMAAVRAVQQIAPDDLHLRLIGVKQIRAFDQEITVVSLLRDTSPPQRLVGAVLTLEDPVRTAALAVLNALNRVLGNYLNTTD